MAENSSKFWQSLSTKTRNALKRAGYTEDSDIKPWNLSIKVLIRIPTIGPGAVKEIASLTEKYCV